MERLVWWAGAEQAHPLPEGLRRRWERESGVELGDVVVHENSFLPKIWWAGGMAVGNHIYLAPGQKKLLRHELVHVIQQKQGRAPDPDHSEELETEARLERPPAPCPPPAEPGLDVQFCKWCGDSSCKLSAPRCAAGKAAGLPAVRAAVRRVRQVDDSFLPSGYGELTWNGGAGIRPSALAKVWRHIRERDVDSLTRRGMKWKCPYCQREFASAAAGNMQIDHHIPWAEYMRRCLGVDRLGVLPAYVAVALANDPTNLTAACGRCNASKSDKIPGSPEYLDWLAGL